MNRSVLVSLIAFVVVVGAIFVFNKNASAPVTDNTVTETVTPTPTPTPSQTMEPEPTPNPTPVPNPTPTPNPSAVVDKPQTFNISMTDSGYSPAQLTIKKGDTVKFTNAGTKPNWPASAPHPTHTDYPAFDPKTSVAVGESWSFKFDQVGKWPYHDHLSPSRFGAIIVTE